MSNPEAKSGEAMEYRVIEGKGDTQVSGVLLDPFMGTGTTGVVALMQGHAFVGIDEAPQSVAIAHHRLQEVGGTYKLFEGDSLSVLRCLPSSAVDAMVTDPPAGIKYLGEEWDSDRGGRDQWVAWLAEIMAECFRVLKPGAKGTVWALPRTSHWTFTALERAGFVVLDCVFHIEGNSQPKSHDVSRAMGKRGLADAAKEWKGWGTALKPAGEMWWEIERPWS